MDSTTLEWILIIYMYIYIYIYFIPISILICNIDYRSVSVVQGNSLSNGRSIGWLYHSINITNTSASRRHSPHNFFHTYHTSYMGTLHYWSYDSYRWSKPSYRMIWSNSHNNSTWYLPYSTWPLIIIEEYYVTLSYGWEVGEGVEYLYLRSLLIHVRYRYHCDWCLHSV